MKNGDMPVAPMLNTYGVPHHHSSVLVQPGQITGLTKRELFAAMALQGFMANKEHAKWFDPDEDATYAVRIADCLLKALEDKA